MIHKKIIILFSRGSKYHGTDYLIPLQETVNDNYTNVYRTHIYQLVDLFLCENNVTEEERRNLPSALR